MKRSMALVMAAAAGMFGMSVPGAAVPLSAIHLDSAAERRSFSSGYLPSYRRGSASRLSVVANVQFSLLKTRGKRDRSLHARANRRKAKR